MKVYYLVLLLAVYYYWLRGWVGSEHIHPRVARSYC